MSQGPPPPAGFVPGGYPPQGGYPGYPPQPGYPRPSQPTQPGYPPGSQPPPGSGYPGGYPATPAFQQPPDMANVDRGYSDGAFAFSDKTIRLGFIRKVYSILMCQIAVTVAIVSLFTFHEGTKLFVRQHPALWLMAIIFSLVTMLTLACCGDFRRKAPMNYICLGIFTLAEGFLLGCATSKYQREEIFYAAAITLVAVAALTLFAVVTPLDFTGLCGILFVCSIILFILGILTILFPSRLLKFIYAGFGALLFTVYIVYDTQQIVGGKRVELSPEEYIFAALNLYVDMISLFMFILQLIGLVGGGEED